MALHIKPGFRIPEKFDKVNQKFERLSFTSDYESADSMSIPSTPSTPCSPFVYDIQRITEEDKDEVLKFLQTFFFKDEPLNASVNLINEQTPRCEALEKYSLKDIKNGINLKAMDNGKLIGVCLNGILERGYLDQVDDEEECNDPKFSKIVELLHHVAKESDIFKQFPQFDKAVFVSILSVDDSYRGKGIAKELMAKTREIGRELGCGFMAVDCSSHFTALALRKLGFKCIYSLNYSDYKKDGKVVFKPAPPHQAITTYAQIIQPIGNSN